MAQKVAGTLSQLAASQNPAADDGLVDSQGYSPPLFGTRPVQGQRSAVSKVTGNALVEAESIIRKPSSRFQTLAKAPAFIQAGHHNRSNEPASPVLGFSLGSSGIHFPGTPPISQTPSLNYPASQMQSHSGSTVTRQAEAMTFVLKKDLEALMGDMLRQTKVALNQLQNLRNVVVDEAKLAVKHAAALQSREILSKLDEQVKERLHTVTGQTGRNNVISGEFLKLNQRIDELSAEHRAVHSRQDHILSEITGTQSQQAREAIAGKADVDTISSLLHTHSAESEKQVEARLESFMERVEALVKSIEPPPPNPPSVPPGCDIDTISALLHTHSAESAKKVEARLESFLERMETLVKSIEPPLPNSPLMPRGPGSIHHHPSIEGRLSLDGHRLGNLASNDVKTPAVNFTQQTVMLPDGSVRESFISEINGAVGVSVAPALTQFRNSQQAVRTAGFLPPEHRNRSLLPYVQNGTGGVYPLDFGEDSWFDLTYSPAKDESNNEVAVMTSVTAAPQHSPDAADVITRTASPILIVEDGKPDSNPVIPRRSGRLTPAAVTRTVAITEPPPPAVKVKREKKRLPPPPHTDRMTRNQKRKLETVLAVSTQEDR
ncbi:uncharacterized protein EV422DRAFT_524462 [Fimicolochytrium jonesii]|uniref:uncharacterized protein n=1 Tax=Fimicolochytrium jonesii TaxID=1396493 RepID=UPI0022FE158D|nr:uncharacterized protein EV422DRAFT_524462 [Fimicolochytrium jonesii]KAI8822559.1 hypothetical protein EV422DRAFT_524462 [Fimicolochytrium jonesii]